MPVTSYLTIDGEILSETRSGVEADYIPDPLGSTIALTDSTQTITDTFTWWPFGEQRSHPIGSSVTPFGYGGTKGYYADSVGNRLYVRRRILRPQTTAWQTVDPLWPRQRKFIYVSACPTSKTGPSGLQVAPRCFGCNSSTNDLVYKVCTDCQFQHTPGCQISCNDLASAYYFQCCPEGKKPGPCLRPPGDWYPISGVGVVPPPIYPYPPPPPSVAWPHHRSLQARHVPGA